MELLIFLPNILHRVEKTGCSFYLILLFQLTDAEEQLRTEQTPRAT